jgi:RNA polymerase sigma factor (sigma-70 family)
MPDSNILDQGDRDEPRTSHHPSGVTFAQGDVLFSEGILLDQDEDVSRDDASSGCTPDDPLKAYAQSIRDIVPLTRRQERGIDLTGKEQVPPGCKLEYPVWRLVHHTQKLVADLARTMPREGVDTQDYIQAGILALIEAAYRWQRTTKRKRFGRFATPAVKAALREVAVHHGEFESKPSTRHAGGRGYRRRWTEVPLPHRLTQTKRLYEFGDPYTETVHRQALEGIRAILTTLRPKEAKLVELRVGFETGKPMMWTKIGEELGVSRERIFEIAHRTVRKLNHPSRKRILARHYDALLSCPHIDDQPSPVLKFLLSIQDGRLAERWRIAV